MKSYRPILFALILLSSLVIVFGVQQQSASANVPNAPMGITLTPTELPTDTPVPPTETPVPPTATPIPPTSTATPTVIPPSPTPTATSTGIIQPPPPPASTPTATPILAPTATPTGLILPPPPPRRTPPSSVVLPLTGDLPIDAPPSGANRLFILGVILAALLSLLLYAFGIRLWQQRRAGVFEFIFAGTLLLILAGGLAVIAWRATPYPASNLSPSAAPAAGAAPLALQAPLQPQAVTPNQPQTPRLTFLPFLNKASFQGQRTYDETVQNWDDTLATRLVIPALNVDAPVQLVPFTGQTWDVENLGKAIALLDATSLPGLGSNTVLMGHITVRNEGAGPFRFLHKLQAGETIIVYTQENVYTYAVREQRIVGETDASIIATTDTPRLTLLTCATWDWQAYKYLERRAVTADLVKIEPAEIEGN